jgi:large subunit ribosomal protein L17
MRHRKHTFKIGRTGAHRKALLANQVCSLITEGKIRTTVVKAKESRRLAEKMITLGKLGDLHHRRLAISKLRDKDAVAMLFAEVAPKYTSRNGGYTRIIRLGTRRHGDAAEMCILQWVEEGEVAKKKTAPKKKEEAVEAKTEEVVAEEKAEESVTEEKVEAEAIVEEKTEEPPAENKEDEKAEAATEKAEGSKEEETEEKK